MTAMLLKRGSSDSEKRIVTSLGDAAIVLSAAGDVPRGKACANAALAEAISPTATMADWNSRVAVRDGRDGNIVNFRYPGSSHAMGSDCQWQYRSRDGCLRRWVGPSVDWPARGARVRRRRCRAGTAGPRRSRMEKRCRPRQPGATAEGCWRSYKSRNDRSSMHPRGRDRAYRRRCGK